MWKSYSVARKKGFWFGLGTFHWWYLFYTVSLCLKKEKEYEKNK